MTAQTAAKPTLMQKINGVLGTVIFRMLMTIGLAVVISLGWLVKTDGESIIAGYIAKNPMVTGAAAAATAAATAAAEAKTAVLVAQATATQAQTAVVQAQNAAAQANQKVDEVLASQGKILALIGDMREKENGVLQSLAGIAEHNLSVEQRLSRIEAKQDAAK